MEDIPGNEGDAVSALLFRVQSRLCALPIAHVVETMRCLPVEPVAGTPRGVKGMALIRGNPIPVVALSALLDDENTQWKMQATRFITIKSGGRHVALAVDGVLGIRRIAASSLHTLPPLLQEADHHAVSAIAIVDAELMLVINAARLLPDIVPDGLFE